MHTEQYVLVVSGLGFEARIARKVKGTRVCCAQAQAVAPLLAANLTPGCCGIVSFGVVGGLDPKLRPGSVIVATDIVVADGRFQTDSHWSASLSRLFPDAIRSLIFSSNEIHADPDIKRRAFGNSGAAVVDMESHIAARVAHEKGLPFAALRVVADAAHRSLPQSALDGVCIDGSTDPFAVLRGLARRPREAIGVAALAYDAWVARTTLARLQRQLGHGFEVPGFRLPPVAIAEPNLELNLAEGTG
jgi:hopanoid-associated phosphorylase